MPVAQSFFPYVKEKCHQFLLTRFVRVWGILDFYTHCGFEVKKLVEMLTQDPILEPFQPILQEGKGKKM